jgi:hypothetical protein
MEAMGSNNTITFLLMVFLTRHCLLGAGVVGIIIVGQFTPRIRENELVQCLQHDMVLLFGCTRAVHAHNLERGGVFSVGNVGVGTRHDSIPTRTLRTKRDRPGRTVSCFACSSNIVWR